MSALVLLLLCLAIAYCATLQVVNGRDLDGWYTWLREMRHDDPDRVFTVVDGQLRISGEHWGAGDFILVGGKTRPKLTCDIRTDGAKFIWKPGGTPVTKESGRFNWRDRDPKWTDTLGFYGATITNIVNGVVVNHACDTSLTGGRIQLQSAGAEIYFRRLELTRR